MSSVASAQAELPDRSLSQTAIAVYQINPGPDMSSSLGVSGDTTPGGDLVLGVTYGNRGERRVQSTTVELAVPHGLAFVSATSGGTVTGEGIGAQTVSWDLGRLESGEGGRVAATFRAAADLPPGRLLHASATTRTDLNTSARAEVTIPLLGESSLELGLTESSVDSGPGQTYVLSLRAENNAPSPLAGVTVRVLLPDEIDGLDEQAGFECPGFACEANETAVWTVGSLASGQARTIALPMSPDGGVRRARVLRTVAIATAEGASPAAATSDVLVGTALVTNDADRPSAVRGGARAYPSPFREETTVEVRLDASEHALVEIFDVTGRLVASLHDGLLPAGTSTLHWRAGDLAPGLYLYRVITPSGTESGPVIKAAR